MTDTTEALPVRARRHPFLGAGYMTVNELREALEKMPGHWPVHVALRCSSVTLRALVKELEGDEPRYTAQEVADACVAAEIPDGKCESLLLALKA